MRPSIQHVLDGLTGAAGFVHNARLDNLAANQLGRALYSDMFSRATGPGPAYRRSVSPISRELGQKLGKKGGFSLGGAAV